MHQRSRPNRMTRGITLVEVLIVTAIVALVVGIVWLALGGRARLAAKQDVIKSDMRQVVVAGNRFTAPNGTAACLPTGSASDIAASAGRTNLAREPLPGT